MKLEIGLELGDESIELELNKDPVTDLLLLLAISCDELESYMESVENFYELKSIQSRFNGSLDEFKVLATLCWTWKLKETDRIKPCKG